MFTYRLIHEDGTPADPPTFESSTPTWRAGDQVVIRPGYSLRVLEVREDADPALSGTFVVASTG
jgi:hypothetical protein